MNIHEYQAKSLLQKFGVAVPRGGVAYTPEEAQRVGVFGAPSFTAGSELFWGNDRLEMGLDWALGVRPRA